MSKKDTKKNIKDMNKESTNKDEQIVNVRVVDNFYDKTNNKKFMAIGTEYEADKERAVELVKLGYVEYVANDANVDTNVNVDEDPNANADEDLNTNVDEDSNANADEDPNTNVDEDSNANADEDSNVPNE